MYSKWLNTLNKNTKIGVAPPNKLLKLLSLLMLLTLILLFRLWHMPAYIDITY